MVPWGLRRLLNHIRVTYNNPPVLITENGVSDNNGSLADEHRANYFRDYINNVLKGMQPPCACMRNTVIYSGMC